MLYKFDFTIKNLKRINLRLLISTVILTVFGVLNIYLCTKGSVNSFSKKQLVWFILSLVFVFIMLSFDYRNIYSYVPLIYWGSIVLLLLVWVPGVGVTVNGARGWINLRVSLLQPAEIAKFAIILMVSKLLKECDNNINNLKNFITILLYIALPMFLILIQKDMGMTMVCFFIVLGMFYIAGLNSKIIGGGFLALIISIVALWNTGIIQSHQKDRLLEFLNPGKDITGNGYQLSQGLIGIGAGGLTGTSPSLSPDSPPGFAATQIPEVHTDFIFTAIGEQFGLFGCLLIILLFGVMIYNIILISKSTKDSFGSLICVGMASYLIFAVAQNIGMTLALVPITGITLPFVSYGGSSLLTTYIALGVILNISIHKDNFSF